MRIEPAVLDGDEGLRQIGRQILQRDIGAGHFAAGRQHAAVEAGDLDGRRPLRNFQRLDRRQMRADLDHDADHRDHRPQAEHRAPIEQAGELKPPRDFDRRLAAAAAGARLALARRRRRRRRRLACVWRLIFSVCSRRRRCGPADQGANRRATRPARTAAPCVRRFFSVPTPYATTPTPIRRTLAFGV